MVSAGGFDRSRGVRIRCASRRAAHNTMKTPAQLLAALLCAGAVHAQTTHHILVDGFSFSPTDVTIDPGDTVRWTWGLGLHDVESGSGGVHDGIFDSGSPLVSPGLTFDVVFDAAFLAAHPVPGDVYGFYCTIHVPFGMEGSVTVDTLPQITPYGCLNPAGSLLELGGSATPGTTWTVGVDNPIAGAQTAGSLAFLGVSLAPPVGYPCGLPIPGWHMDPLQPAGELLLSVAPPDPVLSFGPAVWGGTGSPAVFPLPLPPNPALIGLSVHVQGLIVDPFGTNTFGASSAWLVVLG
jgi:plastocyanin